MALKGISLRKINNVIFPKKIFIKRHFIHFLFIWIKCHRGYNWICVNVYTAYVTFFSWTCRRCGATLFLLKTKKQRSRQIFSIETTVISQSSIISSNNLHLFTVTILKGKCISCYNYYVVLNNNFNEIIKIKTIFRYEIIFSK
jgi:hypothetical protein